MTDCPCHGCKERYLGCHPECDKYKEWKDEYEATTNGLKKEREYTGNDLNKKRFYEFLRRRRKK